MLQMQASMRFSGYRPLNRLIGYPDIREVLDIEAEAEKIAQDLYSRGKHEFEEMLRAAAPVTY